MDRSLTNINDGIRADALMFQEKFGSRLNQIHDEYHDCMNDLIEYLQELHRQHRSEAIT